MNTLTAKPVKKKDLILFAADPDTMGAVMGIADLADPFGDEPEANVTLDNVTTAVEVLARVREAKRRLKDVADTATKAAKDSIKAIDAERKTLEGRLDRADGAVAERLIALYREVGEEALTKRMAGAMGSSVSVVHKGWDITIDDADAVPDEYILDPLPRAQRVNLAAVGALADAGVVVPGTRATKRYYLTTRAAETIKQVK